MDFDLGKLRTRGPHPRELGRDILFFDGGMGTMLQARGLKLRELPESLNLTHPDLIRDIHREYAAAGADFITTNTFGANPFKLERAGLSVDAVVPAAVRLAREAAGGTEALTALDIGPTGRVMAPLGDASFNDVYDAVAAQVRAGRDGSDVVLLETFTDLRELRTALLAVKENCSLPVLATMSFEEGGRTFFGATVASMVMTLEGLGVAALGVNCSLGPAQLIPIVREVCALAHAPVMVQPNAGLPVMRDGASFYDVMPDEFAEAAVRFAEMGCAVLGGCCGTTPAHITKVAAAVRAARQEVAPRSVPDRTCICTPGVAVSFGTDFVIIGERLNPTGKKALQAAIRAGDMDYVLKEALKQQDQGSHVLDVNMGLPDVDEPAMLRRAVEEIQAVIDLPLQLDSPNPAALEAGARAYNGKPLLNSVNGKEKSLETVLPIARKYGACVLGLALDDDGIPGPAEDRLAVARRIVREAERLGIPRRDVLIDCLTLTASAQQDLVRETLRAVRMVKEELGVSTVLGLSNVSFGLPRRPLINRTMFAAALMQGLDAAIINPGDQGMRETLAAWRLLSGIDREAHDYIAYCQAHPEPTAAPSAPVPAGGAGASPVAAGGLDEAIVRGLKDEAAAETDKLLRDLAPLEIVEKHVVPALDSVGREYEAKRLFLPQLIKSADAAKAAFERLKAALASSPQKDAETALGPIVLCTVYGDVHDIGKNIVKVILENYNFKVVDLGKDVPPEQVVAAVRESGARVVGLSALMTTTVASMKDTIERVRSECPGVKVLVGGAVLTPDLARFTGADFYARDAMESVRIASEVLKDAGA